MRYQSGGEITDPVTPVIWGNASIAHYDPWARVGHYPARRLRANRRPAAYVLEGSGMVPSSKARRRTMRSGSMGVPCTWTSDCWWNVADPPVYADSFSYVVTPSGAVRATSTYPAVPLACE